MLEYSPGYPQATHTRSQEYPHLRQLDAGNAIDTAFHLDTLVLLKFEYHRCVTEPGLCLGLNMLARSGVVQDDRVLHLT
jgi:hypothetical protein